MLVQRQEMEESCMDCSLSRETEEGSWLGCVCRPRWDLEEEGGREGDGSPSREMEEGAWLTGGGTSWDLRLEEGVVEMFWLFLDEVADFSFLC